MSIVTRIFLLIAITLSLVAGGELFNGLNLREKRLVELRRDTVQLARIAELDMVRILDGTHQLLATLAKLPAKHGWDERACAVVEATASSDFEYDHILAADRNGIVQCTSTGAWRIGTRVADRTLVDRVVSTAGFTVGTYGIAQVSRNEVIRVGYPVVDDAGTVTGVVYAGINVAWLNTALNQWQLGENVTILITDRHGILIAQYPDPSAVGQPVADALQRFLSAPEFGTTEATDAGGVARLYGYVPTNVGPSDGLAVFVGLDRARVVVDINRSIWLSAAVVLIGLLLCAVIAFVYVRQFLARPFQNLLTVAGRWRDGDWSARAGAVSGIPEFDRLALAFDGMAAEVSVRDSSLRQAGQELRQERDFTAAVIDSMPGLFVMVDDRGRIVRWNENLPALTGITGKRLQGLDATGIVVEEYRAEARERLAQAFAHGTAEFEGPVGARHGGARIIRFKGRTIAGEGHPYLLAIGTDVTEERAAEARLRESEERFRAVSEAAQDAIIMIDRNGKVVYWNRSAARILGYEADEAIGRDVHDWLAPRNRQDKSAADMDAFVASGEESPGWTLETTAIRKDGAEIPVEVSLASMLVGTEWHAVAILRDITERKRTEVQITRMARHDVLTGLVNRHVFVEELAAAIALAHRGGYPFAVLYIDLDHFKDINDTLGHPVGDLLLQSAAERLRDTVRKTDIVARFGGDEFAVIAAGLQESNDAAIVAANVLSALSEPFQLQGTEVRSGGSVGISVYGPDSTDAETLLSHADVALYRAKSEGRGTYRFFTDAMDAEVRTRVKLSDELRKAIPAGQLFLVYQPQVDSVTGRIIGIEALVRWRHPTKGVISPDRFVHIAERSGLIVALGRWVLREACRQLKEWLDAGIAPPLMAINLSGQQFKTPRELENDITAVLKDIVLPPEMVELELTESVLMDTSRAHSDVLVRLRQAGFRIAIDDFGTGYSSLDYLRRFPVDRIKIAHLFLRGLTEASGGAIVKAAIDLARALKLGVVVEGVETAEQLALIQSWGGRDVQGYYFSRPVRAKQAAALLRVGTISPAAPAGAHPPLVPELAPEPAPTKPALAVGS